MIAADLIRGCLILGLLLVREAHHVWIAYTVIAFTVSATAFFEPSLDWIPPSALWSIQVGAVVVGHIVGAWAGHAVAARQRGSEHGRGRAARAQQRRADLRAQLPLAVLMVVLTGVTLWSLGQNLVFETEPERHLPAVLRSVPGP